MDALEERQNEGITLLLAAIRHASPAADPLQDEAIAFVEDLVRVAPAMRRLLADLLAEMASEALPAAFRLRFEGRLRDLLRQGEAAVEAFADETA